MAQYVPGGADLIDIMAGGRPDDATRQWFAERAEMVQQNLSNTSRAFFDRARSLYQTISESQALQMLRNLRTKSDNVWSGNVIEPLRTLEALQTASPVMQRMIMAQPDLRRRYLNQEVEAYGDSYTNYHGDTWGPTHFDYRRVMDGVLDLQDDEKIGYVIRHYVDYMEVDDRVLSLHEKIDILNTWDVVKQLLEEGGEDPTSPVGNQL
jgi:hypothetical protein